MKSAESKTAAALPAHAQEQAHEPFFQKDGQGSFFSEGSRSSEPFFSPNTVQPKLTIGRPGDKYEQEADAMAEKVVGQMSESSSAPAASTGAAEATPAAKTSSPNGHSSVQAQSAASPGEQEMKGNAGEGEVEGTDLGVQKKAIFESNEETPPEVQTKPSGVPAVQAKCSACEEEEKLQKKETEEELPELQTKPIFESNAESPEETSTVENGNAIQRMCAECAAEEENADNKETPEVQTHTDAPAPAPTATPDLQARLNNTKSGGQPLPENTRSSMESGFGTDFSGVRVHTGSASAQMNKELGAHAFTHGSDIYFNEGKYDTGSTDGKKLLAHELTHTVQQGGGLNKKEMEGSNGVPEVQTAFWDSAVADLQKDKCEEKGKEKGSEEEAKSNETTDSEDSCPQTNPPAQQPPEGQKEPGDEEKPAAVGSQEGSPVKDRQGHAPPPEEKTPQVPPEATQEAQKEPIGPCEQRMTAKAGVKGGETDAKQDATPKAGTDKGEKAQKGTEKATKAQEPGKGEKEKGEKEASTGGEPAQRGLPDTVKPEGLGEAASPELATERDGQLAGSTGAMALLWGTKIATMDLGGGNLQFLQPDVKNEPDEKSAAAALERHSKSSTLAGEFVRSGAGRLNEFADKNLQKADQIRRDTSDRKLQIAGKIQGRREQAKAHIANLKEAARTKAKVAESRLDAKYKKVVDQIEAKAFLAQLEATVQHFISVQLLEQKRTAQVKEVEQTYTTAYSDIKNIGTTVGGEAKAKGETRAQAYERAEGVSDPKIVDKVVNKRKDGFWDGYLTYNRYKARAKSAREIAKQYSEGFVEESQAQADKLMCDKPTDLEKVNTAADKALESLQCTLDTALESIEAHRTTNLQNAGQMHQETVAGVRKSLQTTSTKLSEQEAVQLQFLNDYGIRQTMAVERDAENAVASLLIGANDAATQLLSLLTAFRDFVIGNEAPEPKDLRAKTDPLNAEFSQSLSTVDGISNQATDSSQQGLAGGGDHTLTALDSYGDTEMESSSQIEVNFEESIDLAVAGAMTGFDQLLEACQTKIGEALTTALSTFESVLTGLNGLYTNLNKELTTRIGENKKNIEGGMRDSVTQDLDNKISCEAEKAAKEVQPWWKSVLKILLIIVVIVVMIVVLGPAAGLLGMVVQGVVAGAVAGAVIQIGNNLIDGKKLTDGLVQAVVLGAIGGAFGGVGGHFAGALVKGVQGASLTIGQHVLRGGIELAFDTAGGVLGDLAVGNPITLESVALGATIGAGVNIGSGGLGALKSKISGAVKPKVGVDVAAPHAKPELEVSAPKTKVEPSAPKSTEPSAGTTTPKATEPTTPKAGEPSAPKSESATTPKAGEPAAPKGAEPGAAKTPAETPAGPKTDAEAPKAHLDEPEIEPGVVAKAKGADGHDVKVRKDGSCEICSDCLKIKQKYDAELSDPRNKILKDRLDAIEQIPDPRLKAQKAAELDNDLAGLRKAEQKLAGTELGPKPKELIDPNTGKPVGAKPETPALIDPNTGKPVGAKPEAQPLIDPNTGKPIGAKPETKPLIDPTTGKPFNESKILNLEQAGLPRSYSEGLSSSELQDIQNSLTKWNVVNGKNQGVTHTVDYAAGKGGAGKSNRMEKLHEYTGKGPFDPTSPDLIPKATRVLDEITTNPTAKRTVGDKEILFIAKGNVSGTITNSQKGIIVIKFQGKYSTFMNSDFKGFNKVP